jgi:hypothetical protein
MLKGTLILSLNCFRRLSLLQVASLPRVVSVGMGISQLLGSLTFVVEILSHRTPHRSQSLLKRSRNIRERSNPFLVGYSFIISALGGSVIARRAGSTWTSSLCTKLLAQIPRPTTNSTCFALHSTPHFGYKSLPKIGLIVKEYLNYSELIFVFSGLFNRLW